MFNVPWTNVTSLSTDGAENVRAHFGPYFGRTA